MNRRTYVTGTLAISTALVAGCADGDDDDDANIAFTGIVTGNVTDNGDGGRSLSYTLETGSRLVVWVENRSVNTAVEITGPDGEQVLEDGVQDEETFTLEIETAGEYIVHIQPAQSAEVEITIYDPENGESG